MLISSCVLSPNLFHFISFSIFSHHCSSVKWVYVYLFTLYIHTGCFPSFHMSSLFVDLSVISHLLTPQEDRHNTSPPIFCIFAFPVWTHPTNGLCPRIVDGELSKASSSSCSLLVVDVNILFSLGLSDLCRLWVYLLYFFMTFFLEQRSKD